MIDHRTAMQKSTVAYRPGTMTAFILVALTALIALGLTLAPAFAASPGGILLLATFLTAAAMQCRKLLR